MVYAVEIAVNHYLSIPYQKFTEKIIAAKGFLATLDDNKEKVAALEEIDRIMKITDDKLHISLFDIDRWVDPDKTSGNKVTFKVEESHPNREKRKHGAYFDKKHGDDYKLQRHLCNAISRVNFIVMERLSQYSKDYPIKGPMSEW